MLTQCNKLMKIAHQQLHIKPKEFWELTFLELKNLLKNDQNENFTKKDLQELIKQFENKQ